MKKSKLHWKLGLFLVFLFGTARFIAVLYGIQSGNNQYLSIIFLLMILTPFLLLNKDGRKAIGFNWIKNWRWIFNSILIGILTSLIIGAIGFGLYGNSIANWFFYIGESYPIDLKALTLADKHIYFWVFMVIGITFSPFGEELLYRGVVHGSFVERFGERGAAILDSAAFGITHLAHFGIVWVNEGWSWLIIPSLIWMVLMFLTGLMFNISKAKSNSIWGAIISHMGFNAMMTYFIFYLIFS